MTGFCILICPSSLSPSLISYINLRSILCSYFSSRQPRMQRFIFVGVFFRVFSAIVHSLWNNHSYVLFSHTCTCVRPVHTCSL
ncbi:hypothetical protein BC832DRAFT_549533 [Gaertneriomyces semiglobifer]|nr:hypothetical protein BC832DRAFT_549533 [Gaertneriomyces semiglobifer]